MDPCQDVVTPDLRTQVYFGFELRATVLFVQPLVRLSTAVSILKGAVHIVLMGPTFSCSPG